MRRLAFALALLVLPPGTFACSKVDVAPTERSDAGAPVDPALLAFLSKARSAHHRADLHEEAHDLPAAIAALTLVVDGQSPGTAYAEVREVLADARARLADLESQRGGLDAAERHLERGLEQARETTYFRGHLFEVRGLIEERRAKALASAGDEAGATRAKKAALDAFEESMKIQEKVIESLLPEGPLP